MKQKSEVPPKRAASRARIGDGSASECGRRALVRRALSGFDRPREEPKKGEKAELQVTAVPLRASLHLRVNGCH